VRQPNDSSPVADAPPSWALIDSELSRLAASALFRRSPRHLRFLRHLVQCTLKGESARLRELALGVEVFLRRAECFDPRQDSIVRVEARRLRQKLSRWYAGEGADARLEFVLTAGRYDVQLRRRSAPTQPRGSVAVFELPPSPLLGAALQATLAAELAAALARLNGLRVVRGGAPPVGGDGAALQHAQSLLQVEHVVLGEVGAAGDESVLRLRVLRCEDAGELWSRRALLGSDRSAAGLHTLETLESLARGIVSALHRDAAQRQLQRVHVAGSHPLLRALAHGGPTAPGLELLGLARIALRQNDVQGCRKGVQLSDQAVALMPGHAPAFALLADALIATVGMTVLPPLPSLQAARRAAERAIELDPDLADAHGQLGFLLAVHERDWPQAEARLLRALQLAPALAAAHARYGWSLMMHRRFDEARACYREARDLDPLSLLYRAHEALIAIYQGHHQQAEISLDAVLDVSPGHLLAGALRAALLLYTGRADEALVAYQALQQRAPGLSIGRCGMAQARAMLGDDAAARLLLQGLVADHAAGYVSPYQIAMVQARLGDEAQALHWLADAARQVDFNYACIAVDPTFDALRSRAPLQSLMRDTGFEHVAGT